MTDNQLRLPGTLDPECTTTADGTRLVVPRDVLEKCGYFLPRIMFLPSRIAPNVTWGDIAHALGGLAVDQVDLAAAHFWEGWLKSWKERGDDYVEVADSASTTTRRRTALSRAAACYHWAEFMFFEDATEKLVLRKRVRDLFESSLLLDQVDRVHGEIDISIDGEPVWVPYWLYLPKDDLDGAPFPCVVMSNGLDSMTEVELLSLAEMYWDRGISTLLFDGPGQGIQVGQTPLRVEMEDVVEALLAELAGLSVVDMQRLAFFGVSYGGYFSLRLAQSMGERFRCVVNASGGPRVAPYDSLPRRLKADFQFAFMTTSEDMQGKLDDLELDISGSVKTRILSIHGMHDDIFPYTDLVEVDRAWNGAHRLVLYRREGHVCLHRLAQWSSAAADWVSDQLLPGPASSDVR